MVIKYNQQRWGFEVEIANTKTYYSRLLIITGGEKTPYIYHKKRDKTLFVLQGVVQLVIEGKSKLLGEGDSYRIHPKIMHSVVAIKGDATIIEAGVALEDDIVIVEE